MPPKQTRAAKPKGRPSLCWHLTEATLPPPEIAERVPELAGVEHNPWFVTLMSQHTRTPRRIRPARLIAAVLGLLVLVLIPVVIRVANRESIIIVPASDFFGLTLVYFAYAVLGLLWLERAILAPAPGANPFRRLMRHRSQLIQELYQVNSDPREISRAVLAYHLTLRPRHAWMSRQWLIALVVLPACIAGFALRTLSNIDFAFILPLLLVSYGWPASKQYESIILSDLASATWLPRPGRGPWWEIKQRLLSILLPLAGVIWHIAIVISGVLIVSIGFFWQRDLGTREASNYWWLSALLFLVPLVGYYCGGIRAKFEKARYKTARARLTEHYAAYFDAFSSRDVVTSELVLQSRNKGLTYVTWHAPRKLIAIGLILFLDHYTGVLNGRQSIPYFIYSQAPYYRFSYWDMTKAYYWMNFGLYMIPLPNSAGGANLRMDVSASTPAAVRAFVHKLNPNYTLMLNLQIGSDYRTSPLEILSIPEVQQFTEFLTMDHLPPNVWDEIELTKFHSLRSLTLYKTEMKKDCQLPKQLKTLEVSDIRGSGFLQLHPDSVGMDSVKLITIDRNILPRFFGETDVAISTLELVDAAGVRDLSFLGKSQQIQSLRIKGFRDLKSLEGIQNIQGLTAFSFRPYHTIGPRATCDLSALAHCSSLRSLDLEAGSLSNPEFLRMFANFDQLDQLRIHGITFLQAPDPHSHSLPGVIDESLIRAEARYIETRVRWNDIIEEAIRYLRGDPNLSVQSKERFESYFQRRF